MNTLHAVAIVVEYMMTANLTARQAVGQLLPHLPDKQKEEIIASATEQYIYSMIKF